MVKRKRQIKIIQTDRPADPMGVLVAVNNKILESNLTSFAAKWNSMQLDWWNTLLAQKLNNKNELRIPVLQTRELLNKRKKMSSQNFFNESVDIIDGFTDIKVKVREDTDEIRRATGFHLFSGYYIDENKSGDVSVVIQVDSKATGIFKSLKKRYTRYALDQVINLKSNYAKRLHPFLKKWRTHGGFLFHLNDFKEKLGVPKSYKASMIDKRVIDICLQELAPYFSNLCVKKVYSSRGHRRLSGYRFIFKEEKTDDPSLLPLPVLYTRCLYNIWTNKSLSKTEQFLAVDRYRSLKLGSTEQYTVNSHPLTFLIDSAAELDPNSIPHRKILSKPSKMTITILKTIILLYEAILRSGKAMSWDLDDLSILEKTLFVKQVALMKKTAHDKDPYQPTFNTIAGRIIKQIFPPHTNYHYDGKAVSDEIEILMKEDFGIDCRKNDD